MLYVPFELVSGRVIPPCLRRLSAKSLRGPADDKRPISVAFYRQPIARTAVDDDPVSSLGFSFVY